jgi:hypothetical protein
MAGVDVEGYINFRQGQREAYEQSWVGKTTNAVGDFGNALVDITKRSYDLYYNSIVNWPENAGRAILNALPNEGGFTLAKAYTGSADFGIGVAAARGEFFAFDFETKVLSVNNYWNGQSGGTVGVPGFDDGLALAVFDTPDYEAAFSGWFNASGGQVAMGPSVTWESIITLPSPGQQHVSGIELTLGVGSLQIEGHSHIGYGDFNRDTTQEINFSDVPGYFWDRFWGSKP